jgi:hypothetical protein
LIGFNYCHFGFVFAHGSFPNKGLSQETQDMRKQP